MVIMNPITRSKRILEGEILKNPPITNSAAVPLIEPT